MNTRYLLFGTAALFGAAGFTWCHAQPPPAPPPPPVIIAPKAVIKAPPTAVATNVTKPKAVWCPACRGRKTIGVEAESPCRSCTGTGKIVSGFSKTEAACNFCKGSGKVLGLVPQPCPLCQAKGVLDTAFFEQFIGCTNCAGIKVLEVDTTVTCTTCAGAGKIVKAIGVGGGGSFGSSGGFGGRGGKSSVGVNTTPQEQPCPFCYTTGKIDRKVQKTCPTCYGVGTIPPPPPPPAEPKTE